MTKQPLANRTGFIQVGYILVKAEKITAIQPLGDTVRFTADGMNIDTHMTVEELLGLIDEVLNGKPYTFGEETL